MKRINNIYHYVYDLGNLKLAILNAAKYKKQRPDVQRVLKDVDGCALILQNLLINKSYMPSPCKMKTVTVGTNNKKREVCCPEFFPDLCIQWALIQILSPVIMKSMYIYIIAVVFPAGATSMQKEQLKNGCAKITKTQNTV